MGNVKCGSEKSGSRSQKEIVPEGAGVSPVFYSYSDL
jgi:hypothetical protein